ncbi:MAG TPA: tRNA pseudouridine(55) synthase TruB [Armatimonadota bacterium]|nr:tRNA pseudouridine(55) synthase TruB [Armatimonadota bacterium]
MDGVLNVNKPAGPTSHDVVARIRRTVRPSRVGHAGALDPIATGVLLICLNNATRIVEYLMDWPKSYRAMAVLGVETDTEDAAGSILRESDCSHISREDVEAVLPPFIGEIMQIPPMVSAVHHKGRRLYELARAGEVVERAPRPVEIFSLRLSDFEPGPRAKALLEVDCSRGTYVRTLCADIGRALDCGAHMSSLVRTAVGRFRLEDAVSIEAVEEKAASERLSDILHPIDEVLADFISVGVSDADTRLVANGAPLASGRISLPDGEPPALGALLRIHGPDDRLLAIGRLCSLATGEVVLKPDKVFAECA